MCHMLCWIDWNGTVGSIRINNYCTILIDSSNTCLSHNFRKSQKIRKIEGKINKSEVRKNWVWHVTDESIEMVQYATRWHWLRMNLYILDLIKTFKTTVVFKLIRPSPVPPFFSDPGNKIFLIFPIFWHFLKMWESHVLAELIQILQYCTITTKCSRHVMSDGQSSLDHKFTADKSFQI